MLGMDPAVSLFLRRGVRRGWVNVWRERGWSTTLAALLGIAVLAQLFLVISFGVQGIERLLRSQTDLRLEVKPDATDQQIQEFFAAVRQLPYVEDALYITREEAYERERKRDPELVSFLEQFQLENPFPDTIAVVLRSLEDYEHFSAFSKQPQWQNVIDPSFLSTVTDQETQVYELLQVARSGKSVAFTFLFLIGLLLLLVLMDLVRRRSLVRAEEIIVERLVGAHELAVLIPFATEAAILLFCSFLLSAVIVFLLLGALPLLIPALADGGVFASLRSEVGGLLWAYVPLILALELLLTPILAFTGAWLGMRPSLKSSRLSLTRF